MTPRRILIVSGEPSGDLHAANLVISLKMVRPNIEFFGIGGELSRKAGVRIIYDITDLALVGLVEVLRHAMPVKRAYDSVIRQIEEARPDLAILVDYPGFNLRLAKELNKRSIPVAYYISPQIWAWGMDRIGLIKRFVKKMLVFFKFEEELYRKNGIDAEFVGHPLVDEVKTTLSKAQTLKKHGLSADKATIALLPGSRKIEVGRLLPLMMEAAHLIHQRSKETQFVISKFHGLPKGLYEDLMRGYTVPVKIVEGDIHNMLSASDLAIVASGTATLETAMLGVPFIIIYKTNWLTFLVGSTLKTVKFLGIPNIIARREIVPELIQSKAAPSKIAERAIGLLSDEKARSSMIEELKKVRDSLGSGGASERAARAIAALL